MSDLPDLRAHVRDDPPVPRDVVVVRGGPDSTPKIEGHAARTARAYVLDGQPVFGVSVFAALDDIGPASLDGLLGGKLSTYRVVHLVAAGTVVDSGFTLLPTFGRPHMTLVPVTPGRAADLLAVLGDPEPNPQYGETRRRPRR